MNAYDIVKRPRISEKSVYGQTAHNQYTFEVHPQSNKNEIKKAIESLFGVKVEKVNTLNKRGTFRRVGKSMGIAAGWKKAIVTLADGDQIEGV
jgi:large subunit ribosomal protein L23